MRGNKLCRLTAKRCADGPRAVWENRAGFRAGPSGRKRRGSRKRELHMAELLYTLARNPNAEQLLTLVREQLADDRSRHPRGAHGPNLTPGLADVAAYRSWALAHKNDDYAR